MKSTENVEFRTIKDNKESEIIEKKSRFIGNVFYIESIEEAEKYLQEIKEKYKDARHYCYAYSIICSGQKYEKSSDDGEPSGTAGAPLLNIIKQNKLENVLIVVTRYFGGILLGTGGLCRAYTKAATESLQKAEIIVKQKGILLKLEVGYDAMDKMKYYCKQNKIKIQKIDFLENIEVFAEISKNIEKEFIIEVDKLIGYIPRYEIILEKNIEKFD